MTKKELFNKFYKNCGRTPDFNWQNLLERKYKELIINDLVEEAIIIYCKWNKGIENISDKDYDYYKNILTEYDLL